MDIATLTKQVQSRGVKGKAVQVKADIEEWLQVNQINLEDENLDFDVLIDTIVKVFKANSAITTKNSEGLSTPKSFSLNPQDYEASNQQAANSLKALGGADKEAEIILNEFQKQAEYRSQALGNQMLGIYNNITPSGLQYFAETLQQMDQNDFYGNRAEFFRQQIEGAFSNNDQLIDSAAD